MTSMNQHRPNIVLVLADSMRARNVSCYGYCQETTPHLDRLAAKGVRFANAFTVAPFTVASTSSILTGVYPSVHRLEHYGQRLANNLTTLPELLRAEGYHTAGFVANPHINPDAGLTRGFDYFTDGRPWYKRPKAMSGVTAWAESGKALNRRVQVQLRRLQSSEQPFFFLVFYNDSHIPYSGLARIFLRFAKAKYHSPDFERIFYTDAELAQVIDRYNQALRHADLRLRLLQDAIERSPQADDTVFIVGADHGEGLDRRLERAGHGRLYENGIHVPLVISSPTIDATGLVIDDLITTLDIAPTVCDLAGVRVPEQFQGRSLRPLIESAPAELPRSSVVSEYHDSRCVRTYEWKLIQRGAGIGAAGVPLDGFAELYDLIQDEHEEVNVAASRPDVVDDLRDILQRFVNDVVGVDEAPMTFQGDRQVMERLRGLGYVE